ncbi:MAG: serine--tRNA ligase [Clostridia bacterium]|jgi:seryl-tRNA synthetase|nr:serine--tRNA ligase [Clostridia bacterium]
MLDINFIRENEEEVKKGLLKRMDTVDFTELFAKDDERKKIIEEVEVLKAERNKASDEIGAMKREGKNADEVIAKMKAVSDKIKELDTKLNDVKDEVFEMLKVFPNIPDEDVLGGGKENNKVIRAYGEKPEFEFEIKNHYDLSVDLGLVDYERGVKLGGNNSWVYTNKGAILEWALINYFVEEHIKDGYEFILPPHILKYECGYAAGQFPKFEKDVFMLEGRKKFLLPTSETAILNLHRDEIIQDADMNKKYFSYTPCYREEAGSYRAEERGVIRGNQFNKVEMFQFTRPEDSDKAFDELVGKAEKLVQGLGLHYVVSKLAAGDCSAAMARTYDIEIWIPSMGIYKEVSSASNGRDYQARRAGIRFKRDGAKKTEFIHTLNASGLATSRLLPAILEQNQQADGSVLIPEVLRKWFGGAEYLK